MPSKQKLIILVILLLTTSSLAYSSNFVGSNACQSCHSEAYNNWQGSHHDLAMQHAETNTVLGDFSDSSFSSDGIRSRFFKKNGKFWVNTESADGSLQDFEIKYTFGLTPLQQYLIEFPDGRIQALGIAWDTRKKTAGGQRWFDLYPNEIIKAGDELHWTGRQLNWNYMCADCHSTDLKKGYDPKTNRFKTTYAEINVGCEACHGPAKQHLAWAQKDKKLKAADTKMGLKYLLDDRRNASWVMDKSTGTAKHHGNGEPNQEVGVCAACHSRRGLLKPGIETDGSFLDHYRPALLSQNLYHADGQIQDEVYVWGSFTQSKMSLAGVTCSDCHLPHSLKLRAKQELVCNQCHLPQKYTSPEHHKHQAGSAGANCLDCHMPASNYMVVDPRRDHSLRIPHPQNSLNTDTPNACNQCHSDKTTQWAVTNFEKMWPDAKAPSQYWQTAFSLARSGQQQAEIALIKIIRDKKAPTIARATAMSELAPFLSPLSGQVLQVALTDSSPLVRMASLGVLNNLPSENRYQFARPLLTDPVLVVRTEAARVAAPALSTQLPAAELKILQAAIAEYITTQKENLDRPESRVNLSNLYMQTGDSLAAENTLKEAIALDPKFGPAYVNLADIYRTGNNSKAASDVLNEAIKVLPDDATVYHSLGLLQARNQQLDQAIEMFKKSVELAPESPRYAYVYGVALNSAGNTAGALKALTDAYLLYPRNQEIIFMLASINRDLGKKPEAIAWTNKLLEINPADQNARQFLQSLKQSQ